MTLNQLRKINPKAASWWENHLCPLSPPLTEEQHFRSFRCYKVNGKLYAVWNNGCYFEAFKFDGTQWLSLSEDPKSRGWRNKFYKQGVKTLRSLEPKGGLYK